MTDVFNHIFATFGRDTAAPNFTVNGVAETLLAYVIAFNYSTTRKGFKSYVLPQCWQVPGFHSAAMRLFDPKRLYPAALSKLLHHLFKPSTVMCSHSTPFDIVTAIVQDDEVAEVGVAGEAGHVAPIDNAAQIQNYMAILTAEPEFWRAALAPLAMASSLL